MDSIVKKIRQLKFEEGYTNDEIKKALGVSVRKVKNVTSKKYEETFKRLEAKEKAEEEFAELVKKYLPCSNSLNHLCSFLGLKGVDCYYKKIKKVIEENNLSTEHFGTIRVNPLGSGRNKYTAMSDEEYFINGVKRNGQSLLSRLINRGYKEYKCEECGIKEWNGKPLKLQVHHKNGDHDDNRIENIQVLCPNCHSQTDTYARQNVKKDNAFKITKRANEILTNTESSFIEKEKAVSIVYKEPKICEICGKEINGCGTKYCSHKCAQEASKKFDPTAEEILKSIIEIGSFLGVGKKYGVSDAAIKKRCKKFGIFEEANKYITHRNKR